ncbi:MULTISPECIES: histidine phosphatase family protein [Gibbsiella]|uniref:histidine phosphatase family protein n=1 Tax=Gibbsiella TaxID=929812 RepID=UPI00242DA1E2|nr:histidine phosphatase family protein [Gibbsiella quercinecans]
MEITLMRHGQPAITVLRSAGWVKAYEMHAWIAGYDASEVTGQPDKRAKEACDDSHFIVSSPLQRACSSLSALGANPDVILNDLSEAPLPIINIPWVRLPPSIWLLLFRLFWFLGLASGAESKAKAQKRAKHIAQVLIFMSARHGHICSMGHGFMNKLISLELERLGWKQTDCTGAGYWGWIKYVSPSV